MKTVVEASQLLKYFGKGNKLVKAVDGISLSIQEGEIFGILGPNGAGKTTSIRMILGLLEPDSGEVRILGKNIAKSGNDTKRALGIVPQDLAFYRDLTVEENLWFMARVYNIPKEIARRRINYLLAQMGLEEKRKAPVHTLSGGQKRRLNLILGLIHDPDILFCDEPTPGLDPQSRVAVWEFISQLPAQGKTVILTTHLMEEADRLSDRVAIIDQGKILVLDTPEALKASIGEGDLMEVDLADNSLLEAVCKEMKKLHDIEQAFVAGNALHMRSKNLVPKLNRILSTIESYAEIKNVKLRRTTLEDVFIHLTGKRLRN
ncbi:MAG: ABC transporter ATP-binding protein [Candidatus Hodarchaeota archaeon]